jgi:hypothetical protein
VKKVFNTLFWHICFCPITQANTAKSKEPKPHPKRKSALRIIFYFFYSSPKGGYNTGLAQCSFLALQAKPDTVIGNGKNTT